MSTQDAVAELPEASAEMPEAEAEAPAESADASTAKTSGKKCRRRIEVCREAEAEDPQRLTALDGARDEEEVQKRLALACMASAAAGGPSSDKPLAPFMDFYDHNIEDAQNPKWFERTLSRPLPTPCRQQPSKGTIRKREETPRKSLERSFGAVATSAPIGLLAIMPPEPDATARVEVHEQDDMSEGEVSDCAILEALKDMILEEAAFQHW